MTAVAPGRELSAFDAQFLAAEAGNMLSHYVGLWVAAPDARGRPLDVERVRALVGARIDRVPALRWRLQTVPLGLEHPRFVDGPVDLGDHVLGRTLEAPGGDRELAAGTAEVMATRLDRRRPLWAFHVFEGMPEGRTGIAMKFHHAAADALSAAVLMGVLLDPDPDARSDLPAPIAVTAPPGASARIARLLAGLATQPGRSVRAGWNAVPHLDQVPMLRTVPGARAVSGAARAIRGGRDGRAAAGPFVEAPRMRFNGALSPRRAIAFGEVDVEVVRRLKAAHGTTFNDIVTAAVAGGLRRRLRATGELPDRPLVAFVPANVRPAAHAGQIENAISSFVVPIPTHVDDVVARVRASRTAMSAAKARHASAPTTLLEDANAMIFPVVFAPLALGLLRLMGSGLVSPPLNLTLSNVPGPPMVLHLDGAPLERVAPLSLVFDGVALNVTVVSYAGKLEIGVVGDAEHVPDVWEIVEAVREELAAMLAALPAPAR